jgi:hypothetical protein
MESSAALSSYELRRSALLKDHAKMLRDHDSHLEEIAEYRRRTDQNLAEITDKLNGLIGFVDGMQRPPSKPS